MPKNHYLRTFFIINGVITFANGLLGPLYALFVEKFDTNILTISISWSAFQLSTVFFLLLMRKYGDRQRHKIIFLKISYLIRILVWISFVFVGNIYQLIGLQIALGAAEALGAPTFQALVAEHLDHGKHLEEYSTWKLILYFTSAIATLVGGLIVKDFGFQPLFIFTAILALYTLINLQLRFKNK